MPLFECAYPITDFGYRVLSFFMRMPQKFEISQFIWILQIIRLSNQPGDYVIFLWPFQNIWTLRNQLILKDFFVFVKDDFIWEYLFLPNLTQKVSNWPKKCPFLKLRANSWIKNYICFYCLSSFLIMYAT